VALTSDENNRLNVPIVAVPDAALHRGTVQIRRSTILELQTLATSGVSRTDGSAVMELLEPVMSQRQSPLGVKAYQAYQFNATPLTIELSATPIASRVSARTRTIVRIGETASTIESEVRIAPQRREVYQVDISLPASLQLEEVSAPGLTDWSLSEDPDNPLLRAFFSAGQTSPFALSLAGKLGSHTADQAVPLPQLVVLDVQQQSGSLVVQVDQSLDARLVQLERCQSVLLERVTSWLNPQQRPLARLAVQYSGDSYAGQVQLSPRQPRVLCDTISNVRVTYRDIQETILLDFDILESGIRQITFRLPDWLRDATIQAPRTRQQSVTPIDGQPYVQVRLDLQDAITGQYRVIVEHDRALAPERQLAPLPLVDVGTVRNRYVTLENAGRDEIVVDGTSGMESLDRQSRQWEQLTRRLQHGDFTTAYVAVGEGTEAQFGYRTRQREKVVTAGASIGLARTLLVVDASGAYRASMLLKVDNRTEPYLEIRLPEQSQLWTAHVAGEPVKPARVVGSSDDQLLRIPLIKTAEGDLDYDVVLKYAGALGHLRLLRSVDFPVVRTENINVELSQVQLYLPEQYDWYQFDGTATQVEGEADFDAGFVAYQTQQVEELTQIIRGTNQFSQSRAVYNVKKLQDQLEDWRSRTFRGKKSSNQQLYLNLDSNQRVLEAAEQEIRELAQQEEQAPDNRDLLNSFYFEQRNELSRNNVTRLGRNFQPAAPTAESQPAVDGDTKFNEKWFRKSESKRGAAPEKPDQPKADAAEGGKGIGKARLMGEQSYRVQQQQQLKQKAPQASEAARQVFQAAPPTNQPASGAAGVQRRLGELGTKAELNRAYMDKIQQQGQQQQAEFAEPSSQLDMQEDQADFTQGVDELSVAPQQRLATGQSPVMGRAGLASLDFELPERGKAFYFTTPRGEVQITARPVERQLRDRLVSFAWLVVMVVALAIFAVVVRLVASSRVGRVIAVVLLAAAGLFLMLLGIFPLFGIAMFFGALLLVFDWRRAHREQAEASVAS